MSNPVLQIMLRKYAGDYKADGVVSDAMRDAADEIDRLNKWADSMTDSVLKERANADALIKELQAKLSARPEARRSPEDIIGNIVADICSRKGLSHEWESIDDEIRDEIVAEWLTFFAPSPLRQKP